MLHETDSRISHCVVDSMNITVNGSQHSTVPAITLKALIATLELGDKRLAVEVNEEVVPRSRYQEFVLGDGDRVEIVQAIGGG